jgi:hypothetical protein
MSEESIARKIGAQLIKNSGRNFRKGDMRLHLGDYDFLVDAKEGAGLNLNEKVWAKVCTDATTWGIDYVPMILRTLPDGQMIACIPFDELVQIIDRAVHDRA